MKKNNRQQYLKTWLDYLKGKRQIDPKALADFLVKNLKGALGPVTMKRYNATIIANLYENGFLAGKTGKAFSGQPLDIVKEITLPALDQSLTHNYKKIKFLDIDQPAPEKKPEAQPPARKVKKQTSKKAAKPKAAAQKTPQRKPGPAKKKMGKVSKKVKAAKETKKPGRKPAAKKTELVGRKADLIKMGEGAFFYSLELTQRVEELEQEVASYERLFAAVRQLFSREMVEIEDWMAELMK